MCPGAQATYTYGSPISEDIYCARLCTSVSQLSSAEARHQPRSHLQINLVKLEGCLRSWTSIPRHETGKPRCLLSRDHTCQLELTQGREGSISNPAWCCPAQSLLPHKSSHLKKSQK